MFFNVMDVIFPIMFIVVAGFIVVTIIKGISQWNDNNHAPRLTVGKGCSQTDEYNAFQ